MKADEAIENDVRTLQGILDQYEPTSLRAVLATTTAKEEAVMQSKAAALRRAIAALRENAGLRGEAVRRVLSERERQDAKWGGLAHDKEHSRSDWLYFIERGCARAFQHDCNPEEDLYLVEMVQIAALAIAAIEARQALAREREETT